MTDNHASREHSIWSPSAWEMWSRCPASALATKDIPRKDSDASLRGTWLHEQSQTVMEGGDEFPASLYNTPENMEQVYQATNLVDAYRRELRKTSENWADDVNLTLESKLDLGEWGHPDVGGTVDVSMFNEDSGVLHIIDYKFGHNPVRVDGNGQLRIYAICARDYFDGLGHDVKTVKISIIQPALGKGAFTDVMSVYDLMSWGEDIMIPAIEAAKDPNAPFIPGEKQCKWCPLSGNCEAQTGRVVSIFDQYSEKENILPDELGALLPELDLMETWIAAKRTEALRTLERGEKVPGQKLVRKVTRRKWLDEAKAEKWLASRKIPKEERIATKVISIAQAEKKLKGILKDNAILTRNFEKLITRPTGGLTMAPVDDSREEVIVENTIDVFDGHNEDLFTI